MNSVILVSFILATCVALSYAGHGHQGYFQYLNVPGYGQYEFGYHRGNPSHYTSRYEQGHGWRARTKFKKFMNGVGVTQVRWGDKYGGYGEHYFDYNHVDKGKVKGHGWQPEGHGKGGGGHQSYGHGHHGHHGGYSENIPAVVPGPKNQRNDFMNNQNM